MKKLAPILSLLIFLMSGPLGAQTEAAVESVGTERSKIAAERTRLEAGYLAEDSACYQRFAVNNCLDDVNTRRRETVGDLRRQEVLLNELERKRKGSEQIRRTEDKAVLKAQQTDLDPGNKAASATESRLAREQNKQGLQLKAGSVEEANYQSRKARVLANQKKAQARTATQAEEAEKSAQYNLRQQAAAEKRAKNELDRTQAGRPAAKPLPARP